MLACWPLFLGYTPRVQSVRLFFFWLAGYIAVSLFCFAPQRIEVPSGGREEVLIYSSENGDFMNGNNHDLFC